METKNSLINPAAQRIRTIGSIGQGICTMLMIVGGIPYVLLTLVGLFGYCTEGAMCFHAETSGEVRVRLFGLLGGTIAFGILWMIITNTGPRIHNMSPIGKGICTTLMIVGGLALITLIVLFGDNVYRLAELNSPSHIVLFWLIGGAIGFSILWKIRNVFGQIKKGLVLTTFLVKAILAAAIFCLIDAFTSISLGQFLLGLYLIAISWGVQQAITLKEENDLTV
jgi:hypothetical protein